MRSVHRVPKTAVVIAAMAAVLVPAVPSQAAATAATGDVTFTGTAMLSRFPCEPPAPFGNGPCVGSFAGEWSGHVSGNVGLHAFDVSWTTVQTSSTDSNGVTAAFQFSELVCADLETLAGYAEGAAQGLAGAGTVRGTYQIPGELFPRDVIGVRLVSSTFDWVRSVNTAVLAFTAFDLQLNVADIGWVSVVMGRQLGDATFAVVPPSVGVPSCAKPWPNATATVAGDVPLAQGPVDLP